jgi:hypothetical protein
VHEVPGRPRVRVVDVIIKLHTVVVSNLHMVPVSKVRQGNRHTTGHSKSAAGRVRDEFGDKPPAPGPGDYGYGYGNEGIPKAPEKRRRPPMGSYECCSPNSTRSRSGRFTSVQAPCIATAQSDNIAKVDTTPRN